MTIKLIDNSQYFEYIEKSTWEIKKCYRRVNRTLQNWPMIWKLNRFEEKNKDTVWQVMEYNENLKKQKEQEWWQKIQTEILKFAKTKNKI